jgi:hypothetical protein
MKLVHSASSLYIPFLIRVLSSSFKVASAVMLGILNFVFRTSVCRNFSTIPSNQQRTVHDNMFLNATVAHCNSVSKGTPSRALL